MIPFINRFHGHNSLRYVYKNGQAVRSHSMAVKATPNLHRKHSRVAVVVGKKILKSAVKRNRIRRCIYEYIRIKLPQLDGVYDIVVIISSSDLLTNSHSDMAGQIDQLFDQAGIKISV